MTNYHNPGQQLQEFLKQLHPLDYQDNNSEAQISFISRIDDTLMAEGSFSKLVYESSINYMVRRLINTAEYLKRKYRSDNYPPEKFINELRNYLQGNTRLDNSNRERLIALLQSCLEVKNAKLTSSLKRSIRDRAKKQTDELRCYICGSALSLDENLNNIQIEHVFPKTMGGASQEFNLKLSCNDCNQRKQDYIDANDFHYEKICLVSDKDDRGFSNELKGEYKIAICAKSQYACSVCGKAASEIGGLSFGRINQNDSWHFLNIQAYCDKHSPELNSK